jgi:hypothetical protein
MALINDLIATLSAPLSSGSTVASSSLLSRLRTLKSARIILVEFALPPRSSLMGRTPGFEPRALSGWNLDAPK